MISAQALTEHRRLTEEGLSASDAAAIIELAFNPHQPRDAKGRWSRSGLPGYTSTEELPPPAKPSADKPLSDVLRMYGRPSVRPVTGARAGAALRQHAARVTAAQQRATRQASSRKVSAADLVRTSVESKIYTAAEISKMQDQIAALKDEIEHTSQREKRKTLAIRLGFIGVSVIFAAATGGLALPALIALGVAAMPEVAREVTEYHATKKAGGEDWLVHPGKAVAGVAKVAAAPVHKVEHVQARLKHGRRPLPQSARA